MIPNRLRAASFVLFALLFFLPLTGVKAVEVIVHPTVQLEQLSSSQMRRIFTMRNKQWRSDLPIKVFVMQKNTELHKEFCLQQLGVFPYQLEKIWGKLLFSGLGEPPVVVSSEQEMLQKVKETPGAIGYVREVPVASSVKIMVVESSDE